ncbi:hypothetical protein ALC57_16577 [Trachymyrmex cornetzi]|uniref:Uncharacterized protein n=1 Tax=Trachymyrmex cornetzi TaxID=471704 RepID=A0A151IUY0_9HYME|nr:hypothetical protein ALC57_16577 [Trachymyrmex cornetzi]
MHANFKRRIKLLIR